MDNQLTVIGNDHDLQMMPLDKAKSNYLQFQAFTSELLKKDLDFGVIPGTKKPTLLKPGAEKMCMVYGLVPEYKVIENTVDLVNLFVDYTYKCVIKTRGGITLAECEANCNSMEAKFGYVWKEMDQLPDGYDITRCESRKSGRKISEFDFAINKGETTGQYGKPDEYWNMWVEAIQNGTAKKIMKQTKKGESQGWELDQTVTVYKIKNPDVVGHKNTIMKMAQKRAFVGAMLMATGASEFFTQDLEDMEVNGVIYSDAVVIPTDIPEDQKQAVQAAAAKVATDQPAPPPAQPGAPGEPTAPFVIPGAWHAKAEKCKTPEDVDDLVKKNLLTVNAHPELRKWLVGVKQGLKVQDPAHPQQPAPAEQKAQTIPSVKF